MTNYQRPAICWGNDFTLNIELERFIGEGVENFDLTKCKSIEVYLFCGTHNTKIPLKWTIVGETNNTLSCFVDYRVTHPNQAYGVCVEGNYEDDNHFRWYMQPREGLLIINNSSGQNIPSEEQIVDLKGRVGFAIQGQDLSDYYTKEETNDLLEDKQDTLVSGTNIKTINNQSILGSGDIDLSNYVTDTELEQQLSTKQDELESGVNIKTINNQSILGEGNITIESGEDFPEEEFNSIHKTIAEALFEHNSNISNLQLKFNNQNDTIEDLKSDTEELDTNVSNIEKDINSSNRTIAEVVTNLNNRVEVLEEGGGGEQVQANWDETDSSDPSYIQNKPTLFSGNYNDLSNKPTLFSGNYNDLSNKPNLATVATSGNYNDLSNKPTLFSGDYNDLSNKPTLFSGNYNDLTNKPDLSVYAETSDLATVATSGNYNDLSNKPNLSNYVSSTTSGLSIEVVSALPTTPEDNVIYIVTSQNS